MTLSEKEKMLAGEPYSAAVPEIQADQLATASWLDKYNAVLTASAPERLAVLREKLAKVGYGSEIRPPFHCD